MLKFIFVCILSLFFFKFVCMSIKRKIGRRVKELRESCKTTQTFLGYDSELCRTYINGVENGRRNISITNIEKIAEAFGMDVYTFFNSEIFKD